jgi:hypothetical protein
MIDILYCHAGDFTVNTAAVSVPVVSAINLFYVKLGGLLKYNYIAAKDNCNIETVSMSLPACFSTMNLPADEPMAANISWKSTLGVNFPLLELNSGDGFFGIHCENQEIPFNIYAAYPKFSSVVGCALEGYISKANISMVNVPAVLNTLVFPVYLFLKLKHTIPMIEFP